MTLQYDGHSRQIEKKRARWELGNGISGIVEFSGVENGTYEGSDVYLRVFIL